MSADRPPLPAGVHVIAGLYGLAGLIGLWLIQNGSSTGRPAGLVMAPVCFALAVGLEARVNLVRLALLGILFLSLALELLMDGWLVAGMAGLVELPAGADSNRKLMSALARLSLTLWMIQVLSRDDVVAAFRRPSAERVEEPPA